MGIYYGRELLRIIKLEVSPNKQRKDEGFKKFDFVLYILSEGLTDLSKGD